MTLKSRFFSQKPTIWFGKLLEKSTLKSVSISKRRRFFNWVHTSVLNLLGKIGLILTFIDEKICLSFFQKLLGENTKNRP